MQEAMRIACTEHAARVIAGLGLAPAVPLAWRRGPAHGDKTEVYGGDRFLAALRVHCRRGTPEEEVCWEYDIITITEDGASLRGEPWGWEWEDVQWYIPAKDLPAPPEPTP